MDPSLGQASLKFDGFRGTHEVPAEVLIQTLQGFQRAIWKIAAAGNARVVEQRFRPSDAIKSEFQVRCVATQPSSFALKVIVGAIIGAGAPSVEDTPVTPAAALEQYTKFMVGLSTRNDRMMREAVPDGRWRELLVEDALKYLPSSEDDWWVDLSTSAGELPQTVRLDRRVRALAQNILNTGIEETDDEITFIARLDSFDFQRQTVRLYFKPTKKSLSSKYKFDEEDNLLQSRRRLVEVRATCVLDAAGLPIEIVDVRSITAHDLSRLTVATIIYQDREFTVTPPLVLVPTQDEESEGQLLTVIDSEMGIDCCEASRSELEIEVDRTLVYLWDNYASESDENMTADAIRLANAIRARMKQRGA